MRRCREGGGKNFRDGERSGAGGGERGGGQKRGGRERRGMMREYEQSLLREIGVAPFFFGSRGALEFNMQGGPCCDPKTF